MRQQYHFRKSGSDILIWDVKKLIAKSKDLDSFMYPINNISELDEEFWYENTNQKPTCNSIVSPSKRGMHM